MTVPWLFQALTRLFCLALVAHRAFFEEDGLTDAVKMKEKSLSV
jgi:hypothetical protein